MNYFTSCLFLLMLYGCNFLDGFDKDYYERITQIKFPDEYSIVATADNGEFMTITILELDKSSCKTFIGENNFSSINQTYPIDLMGLNILDSSFRKLPDSKRLLERHVSKVHGKVGWTYLVDTISCRLYCEIDYPDWAGD